MKILAIEKDNSNVSGDTYEPLLIPEAARVWELYQADIIREKYFRQGKSEAVLKPQMEQTAEVIDELKHFMSTVIPAAPKIACDDTPELCRTGM